MSSATSTKTEIVDAGVRVFCVMFNGGDCCDLSRLRHAKFESTVASCSKVETQKLPPINRAAYYHALRVHLQIRTWSELDEVLDPTEFG